MTTNNGMPSRALEHARLAADQSGIIGIEATDAGVAFMAHGIAMIYRVPLAQALEMVSILLPHAFEHLKRDIAKQLAESTFH
jgi:hypothetical protein